MEPFVALGLKAADKVIDKHFHRVPDKAFQPDRYKPRIFTKSQSHNHGRDSSSPARPIPTVAPLRTDQLRIRADDDRPYVDSFHDSTSNIPRNRHLLIDDPAVDHYSRDRQYNHDRSHAHSSRPRTLRRRSSSYSDPRRFPSPGREKHHLGRQPRRRGSASDISRNAQHTPPRYRYDDKVAAESNRDGLVGAAIGATIGGWAAHKAQDSRRRDGKHNESTAITLLGAVVGGLAIKQAIER